MRLIKACCVIVALMPSSVIADTSKLGLLERLKNHAPYSERISSPEHADRYAQVSCTPQNDGLKICAGGYEQTCYCIGSSCSWRNLYVRC